ncbi:MAG TPA: alpha/beta hydrolase, partial [Streptomyces sp.]|nr:alpha/beta hydrolase [Streptomyces sp.]
DVPVLLLTGAYDMNSPPQSAAEFAALIPDATLVVQPGAGHYPWVDDADQFVAAMVAFLAQSPGRNEPGRPHQVPPEQNT